MTVSMENIENFLMDFGAIQEAHGMEGADIRIQFDVSHPVIKPMGNLAYGRMTQELCRCGCRLNTDGALSWCSSPKCEFIKGVK